MLENLKITPTAKKGLEWLKKEYSFTTYSVAVDTVVQFFNNNKINPRETISNNYTESLVLVRKEITELKNFITSDSQSLRKRHGAIERDYFIYMKQKLDELTSEKGNNNQAQIEGIINQAREELEQKNKMIQELKKELITVKAKANNYYSFLEKLNQNMGYKETKEGKIVIINLPLEEVDKLFSQV